MAEFKLKQTAEEVQKAIDDASTPSDWNQTDSSAADFIKNKPFGESYGDTLYWDGNTEGLLEWNDGNYKISDTIVTYDEVGDEALFYIKEYLDPATTLHKGDESFFPVMDGLFMCGVFMFVSESALGVDLGDGIAFSEPGIYCATLGETDYSVTFPGYTGFLVTKKMEEKFIPTSVKADKGPIVLYMDDEKYLYAEVGTNLNADYDTSDATKRITQGDLKGFLASGRAIYFLYGEYKNIYLPAWIKWRGEYGTAGSNVVVNDVAVDIVAYTAEYTS